MEKINDADLGDAILSYSQKFNAARDGRKLSIKNPDAAECRAWQGTELPIGFRPG